MFKGYKLLERLIYQLLVYLRRQSVYSQLALTSAIGCIKSSEMKCGLWALSSEVAVT